LQKEYIKPLLTREQVYERILYGMELKKE